VSRREIDVSTRNSEGGSGRSGLISKPSVSAAHPPLQKSFRFFDRALKTSAFRQSRFRTPACERGQNSAKCPKSVHSESSRAHSGADRRKVAVRPAVKEHERTGTSPWAWSDVSKLPTSRFRRERRRKGRSSDVPEPIRDDLGFFHGPAVLEDGDPSKGTAQFAVVEYIHQREVPDGGL
jgi:hypothetical protein